MQKWSNYGIRAGFLFPPGPGSSRKGRGSCPMVSPTRTSGCICSLGERPGLVDGAAASCVPWSALSGGPGIPDPPGAMPLASSAWPAHCCPHRLPATFDSRSSLRGQAGAAIFPKCKLLHCKLVNKVFCARKRCHLLLPSVCGSPWMVGWGGQGPCLGLRAGGALLWPRVGRLGSPHPQPLNSRRGAPLGEACPSVCRPSAPGPAPGPGSCRVGKGDCSALSGVRWVLRPPGAAVGTDPRLSRTPVAGEQPPGRRAGERAAR